jgi:hypothetical protein
MLYKSTKNQYIFIGFKNSADYIQYTELLPDDIPVQDIIIDGYQIHNYILNVVKCKISRENKRGSFTIWENIRQYDACMWGTYASY